MSNRTRSLVLIALLALSADCYSQLPQFDTLILAASVYDGSNSPATVRNIGISDGHIADMNAAADASATRTINASRLTVMPGFIDPHTHALTDLTDGSRNRNLNYLTQGVTTVFIGNDGAGIPDGPVTRSRLTDQGIGTNVAFYAGHNLIRAATMGMTNRPPDQQELLAMQEAVREEMRAGALGLSTGLYYVPGSFATTAEVIALAAAAAEYGGVYDSHIRDEASYSIGLLAAIDEVIQIARAARLPAHIAHLKALGRDVWGQSAQVVARISAARAEGLQITADQYPYEASGTSLAAALIPAWVRADSAEAMLTRLDDLSLHEQIRDAMAENLLRRGGSESLLVTDADSRWSGMYLSDIAGTLETDPVEAALTVIRSGDPSVASFNMRSEDMEVIARQDWVMTGSDGSSGHPRKYGTYPTAYRDFVLRDGWLSVEAFVHRSSGLVADTFGLCDRGYLRNGRKADLVVVDLDDYAPTADFLQPEGYATGVVHVLVNGIQVINAGVPTGMLPGELINRQTLQCPAATSS